MPIVHSLSWYSVYSILLISPRRRMSFKLQEPPKLKTFKGLLVPPFVSEEWMEELNSFELCSDDVWVVSYPKSGTTWVQQVVKLLRSGGKDDGRKITDVIPFVDMVNKDPIFHYQVNLSELPFPRAFKSHFTYDLMPCGPPNTKPCKYIYIARNPKDVAVSLFHFLSANKVLPPDQNWSDFLSAFLTGGVGYGSWFDHVLGWWMHKDDPNVLFLKFEDMKTDLTTSIGTIAKFIGCTVSKERLEAIVQQSEFESMKSNPLVNYSWEPTHQANPFMRKGMVGDWKNKFTDDQSAQFDTVYAKKMKDSGLVFDFL